MKKIGKRVALALLAVFVIIQFFRPAKNTGAGPSMALNDISKIRHLPGNVQDILKTSCYDCHSNNTSYPWYSQIQPFAWWLNGHIVEGKKEINFSEFATYNIRRQYKKMDEVIKEVKEDEMPLYSYTFVHRDALLSKEQKLTLVNWATAIMDTMKATYPPDSLKIKR